MKFQYHFIAVSKLSMSANTEYISCTSGKYYHETHTNDFLKARISYQYFEKLSLFPASKFLCCCWYIPCRYISQIRRLSSVQSSFRSIVWYVSSYSSTSACHRGIAFHGVTVVELNKGIWLMDFHLKSIAIHPALNEVVQLEPKSFWHKVTMFNKDFNKIKPMAWQLIVNFLGCFSNIWNPWTFEKGKWPPHI